jgi:transcriptional regulator with XRE-family HTH domain
MKLPKYAQDMKAARHRAGLSQEQAAKLCGLSERMWIYYEQGEYRPRAALLSGILGVLDKVQVLQ